MFIKCKKGDLLSGINIVSKAVAGKTTKPILECILIEAKNGMIRLTGNNLNLGIDTYIEGTILEEGVVALQAKLFSDIVRKLRDNDVSIQTTSDYKVTITCEKTNFAIQYMDGADFPALPAVDKEKSVQISQLALKDVIRQTIFSIANNENQKMMTGELMEVKNNVLTVVSLDGHRISIRKMELAGDNSDMSVIVPGRTLIEISKILTGGAEDMIQIYFENTYILFEFENTRVLSRLIDGEYFRISQMLSMDHKMVVNANRLELMSCIDRASLLIQETDRKPIIVSVKNDNNLYIRLDTNMGSMKEEMEIEKEGGEIIIGFNPAFIMDALRVIDDESVSIYMKDYKSPCIIRDEEETYSYIILPININVGAYQ